MATQNRLMDALAVPGQQANALLQLTGSAAPAPDYGNALSAIGQQYPRLSPYLKDFHVQKGKDPGDGRQLEFYPPWESENPNPGKTTIELYKDMKGPALNSAIAGDGLHLLGAIDPRSGQPVDPNFFALKQKLLAARTPRNIEIDKQAYEHERKFYGQNMPSFDDWLLTNRGDAYIRGYLTPDDADEWRKSGVYNPQMADVLEQMRSYLGQPAR